MSRLLVPLALVLLAAPAWTRPLAGTVHIQRGAVSALSGRGEDREIRRGVRSLRLELGDEVRTSPHLEARFIGFDESQCPLEGGAAYRVERTGLFKVTGAGRLPVLRFRARVGARNLAPAPEDGGPALARVRGAGIPRLRGPREAVATLVDGDVDLRANSALVLGRGDQVLIAFNGGGRLLAMGPARLWVHPREVSLERGRALVQGGGAASVLLTPHASLVAAEGALHFLEVDSGGARVRGLRGRLELGPALGARGARRALAAGEGWRATSAAAPAPEPPLPASLGAVVAALDAALANPDPALAADAVEDALAGSPVVPAPVAAAPASGQAPPPELAAVVERGAPREDAPPPVFQASSWAPAPTPSVVPARGRARGGWGGPSRAHPSVPVARADDPHDPGSDLWSSGSGLRTPG